MVYKYDKEKARALLKEAGCLPCAITLAISTSGSGQMQSLPMNELVKQQLEDAGFKVTLQVMDWNALLDVSRSGVPKYPNVDGMNASRGLLDPVSAIIKPVATAYWSPAGSNWGHFSTPEADALVKQIFEEFDPAKRMVLLTKLHEYESEQALMIFVVHDLNPRALSPEGAWLHTGAVLVPGPHPDLRLALIRRVMLAAGFAIASAAAQAGGVVTVAMTAGRSADHDGDAGPGVRGLPVRRAEFV